MPGGAGWWRLSPPEANQAPLRHLHQEIAAAVLGFLWGRALTPG
jgi:hypothetical protein